MSNKQDTDKPVIKVIGRRKIKRKPVKPMEPKDKYIGSLTEKEKMTLKIAREHLGSSFSLERSIGYVDYFCNRNV